MIMKDFNKRGNNGDNNLNLIQRNGVGNLKAYHLGKNLNY